MASRKHLCYSNYIVQKLNLSHENINQSNVPINDIDFYNFIQDQKILPEFSNKMIINQKTVESKLQMMKVLSLYDYNNKVKIMKILIGELQKNGINFKCIKGIFLSKRVYNSFDRRVFDDFDVIIKKEAVEKVMQVMKNLKIHVKPLFDYTSDVFLKSDLFEFGYIAKIENTELAVEFKLYSSAITSGNFFWVEGEGVMFDNLSVDVLTIEASYVHLVMNVFSNFINEFSRLLLRDVANLVSFTTKLNKLPYINRIREIVINNRLQTEYCVVMRLFKVLGLKEPLDLGTLTIQENQQTNYYDYFLKTIFEDYLKEHCQIFFMTLSSKQKLVEKIHSEFIHKIKKEDTRKFYFFNDNEIDLYNVTDETLGCSYRVTLSKKNDFELRVYSGRDYLENIRFVVNLIKEDDLSPRDTLISDIFSNNVKNVYITGGNVLKNIGLNFYRNEKCVVYIIKEDIIKNIYNSSKYIIIVKLHYIEKENYLSFNSNKNIDKWLYLNPIILEKEGVWKP